MISRIKTKTKLSDTKDLMSSSNHKHRLVAEYQQVRIRHDGLQDMLKEIDFARDNHINIEEHIGFEPLTPYNILLE